MITDFNILNKIGFNIIGCAFEVRSMYGRLMLESFYEKIMAIELGLKGHCVERQEGLTIRHKNVEIPNAYVGDTIVDNSVVIEYKALPYMNGEEFRQLMTYLKLSGCRLGYLINFGAKDFSITKFDGESKILKGGIYRIIN